MENNIVLETLIKTYGDVLTISELAQVLKIHEQTLYKWIRTRRLNIAPLKLGNALRFRAADVSSYLTADRTEVLPEIQVEPKRGRGRPKTRDAMQNNAI